MKKLYLSLLIILSILILIACGNKAKDEFKGTIKEINGSQAIVTVDEGENIRRSGDLVEVDLSKNKDTEFKLGDRVKVGYDGSVMEKYPLGIKTIYVELLD